MTKGGLRLRPSITRTFSNARRKYNQALKQLNGHLSLNMLLDEATSLETVSFSNLLVEERIVHVGRRGDVAGCWLNTEVSLTPKGCQFLPHTAT